MKIAFWSNVRHQSGVTAGVALMSVLWAELFAEEIAVTSNHVCNNSLLRRLCGGAAPTEKRSGKSFSYELGEPEYFRLLYAGIYRLPRRINPGLRFIPMLGNEVEMFRGAGLCEIDRQVAGTEHLLIDTACGCGYGSRKILEEAEVRVVLLPSKQHYIDQFFQSGTELLEHSFFILGNYSSSQSCPPSYLIRKYKIPKERIGVILHNTEYEQAMETGTTISYIAGNLGCKKRPKTDRFTKYAVATVEKLRAYTEQRRAEVCVESEEA